MDDAVVLLETEGSELGPTVVEARVVGVVAVGLGGEQVGDALVGDVARAQGGEAFWGEGIGVEGYEGIGGVVLFEGVVEGEEAGEVVCVGDEGCPD